MKFKNALRTFFLVFMMTLPTWGVTSYDVRKFLFEHPEILHSELRQVVSNRCSAYTGKGSECFKASLEMMHLLDVKPIKLPLGGHYEPYIVSFTTELKRVAAMPQTSSFLKDLNTQLDLLAADIKSFGFVAPQMVTAVDIGNLAQKHYGDRKTTLTALAVLLQDLAPTLVQLEYLDPRFRDNEDLQSLYEVLQKLTDLPNVRGSFPLQLFGIPFTNSRIYHVLVPAYLSSQLRDKGYSKVVSFAAPYFMNYIYEGTEIISTFKLITFEPKAIENHAAIEDIYAGEVGALVGIDETATILPFEEVAKWLHQSPLRYHYKRLHKFPQFK